MTQTQGSISIITELCAFETNNFHERILSIGKTDFMLPLGVILGIIIFKHVFT